jgi:hypothetical protein
MGTKNNPGAYDCYANAHPDEPMFILLGRDKFAGSLVELWAEARESDDENATKVQEARDCAGEMREACRATGKLPKDVLDWIPFEMLADALRRRGATVTPSVAHGADEASQPPIQLNPVESEQISAIGHCPVNNVLAIQFKGKAGPGSVYHYKNFSAQLFRDFRGAESIGSYFGKAIKPFPDRFPFVKVS